MTKGSPSGANHRWTPAPSTSRASPVASSPNGTTSTGTGACVPQRVDQLAAVDDDRQPPVEAGRDAPLDAAQIGVGHREILLA